LSKLIKSRRDDGTSTDVITQFVPPQFAILPNGIHRRTTRNNNRRRAGRRAPMMIGNFGGFRLFNALWYFSSQIGWSVDDEANPGEIFVDRRIMIATQWVSNSLMFLPILWTLIARWALFVSPLPLDYYLDGLPYGLTKEMR